MAEKVVCICVLKYELEEFINQTGYISGDILARNNCVTRNMCILEFW